MPRAPKSLPPRPSKDLNASRRPEPKLHRAIPQEITDLIHQRREAGHPYKYTTRDVQAIVRYTSDQAASSSCPSFFAEADQAKADKTRRTSCQFGERIAAERTKTLAERIEKPRLADRIAAGTYILHQRAQQPLIDFNTLSHEDTIGIFIPKLKATIRRLAPLIALDRFHLLPNDIRLPVQKLVDGLDKFYNHIATRPVDKAQWQALNFGLREIGKISFKGLRPNHARIALEVARVY